ncbi:tubulin-like doman-containing protein [Corynebacterium sp. 335C]
MQKFLVVGCGGSGAKTQAYMIDQLMAYLRTVDPGRTRLPAALQFVSVDVPLMAEPGPDGLGNVPDHGGRYVSIGSSLNYSEFDRGLSDLLGREGTLGEIATWAPRDPAAEAKPISAGAGQYRAIGRMLTIQGLEKIRDALVQSLEKLYHADTIAELNELNHRISGRRSDATDDTPIILVVTSMAGGAGASMFLDVSRILTTIPGVDPANIAVFMMTPEVFGNLSESQKTGMWPNALAVFGEAFAAQTGAALPHDEALYRAMGISETPRLKSFGRLFPIGARMGGQGARFGDGSTNGVYRGLARALAALVSSDRASHDFKGYRLANTGSLRGDRSVLGWGNPEKVQWDGLPWGSMGYAQLSMGRDRFAEYSAQRLARAAFDRLLDGHIRADDPSTGLEQLNKRLDEELEGFRNRCYLASPRPGFGPDDAATWVSQVFGQKASRAAAHCRAGLRNQFPPGDGMRSSEWADLVRRRVADSRGVVGNELRRSAYASVHEFADFFADGVIAVVEEYIARYGVPMAEKLVEKLTEDLQHSYEGALSAFGAQAGAMNPLGDSPASQQVYEQLNVKGTISQTGRFADRIADSYAPGMHRYACAAVAELLPAVFADFRVNVLAPLARSLDVLHKNLDAARVPRATLVNLADVATSEPGAWPTESDELVEKRFEGSANEIMITDYESFKADYEDHITSTMRTEHLVDAVDAASREIVHGRWETTGPEKAPEDTLARPRPQTAGPGNRVGWVARALTDAPNGQGPKREVNSAKFEIRLMPADLIDRARKWIGRPAMPFSDFIGVDLRSYLSPENAGNDQIRSARLTALGEAFRKALKQARPLAAVDTDMLSHVHSSGGEVYEYIFSEIPFDGTVEPLQVLTDVMRQEKHSADESKLTFEQAMTDDTNVTSIEVFGSYPNYSPVVFSSLFKHIAEEWAKRRGNAEGFWSLRRSRPLPAALPLSDDERRAMVAGWMIGEITGRIRVRNPRTNDETVDIWDDADERWTPFPPDLLTPPNRQLEGIDRMPAVIESILLAYANCQRRSGVRGAESLRPYQLLRALYDTGREQPTTGSVTHSAGTHLAEWFALGEAPQEVENAATLEERSESARKRLDQYRLAASLFLPGGPRPELASIRSRSIASKTPLFRDLAPDVEDMATDLIRRLDQAVAEARNWSDRSAGGAHRAEDPGPAPQTGLGLGDILGGGL